MTTYDVPDGFDLEEFLARPSIARVATNGPTIRPVWYLWEEDAFWWLTGSWSSLPGRIQRDPAVVLLIDTWEPSIGEVLKVMAAGRVEICPFDPNRARRKLARYLGDDETKWDQRRFKEGVFDDPTTALMRLRPDRLTVSDLSYRVLR